MGRSIVAARQSPAATMTPESTLRTTRIVDPIPVVPARINCLLDRVPGERGRRAAALVHVAGARVERRGELVPVLVVGRERAQVLRGRQVRESARVHVGATGAAAGR